jgi:hypothetical protein
MVVAGFELGRKIQRKEERGGEEIHVYLHQI